jgi:hypothetical protein
MLIVDDFGHANIGNEHRTVGLMVPGDSTSLHGLTAGICLLVVLSALQRKSLCVLGFMVKNEPGFPRCIAGKAIARFKDRVRELTRRHRGVSLERIIGELNPRRAVFDARAIRSRVCLILNPRVGPIRLMDK